MKIQTVVHEAEEGGYWSEAPAILGCSLQGHAMEELQRIIGEAIEGRLYVPVANIPTAQRDRVMEIPV